MSGWFNVIGPNGGFGFGSGGGGVVQIDPLGTTWQDADGVSAGNSITDNQGVAASEAYHQVVKDILKMKSMTKYGYPGIQWAYKGSGTDDSISSKRTLWSKTAHLYTLYGGANDLRLHIPIGTIDDTTTTTFYGALNTVITYLKANTSNAKIVLITSVQRNGGTAAAPDDTSKVIDINYTNMAGHKLDDYNNAIRALGRKYNLRVIDLFHGSAISTQTISTYMQADGVHPNAAGHYAMALPIVGALAPLPRGADPMPGAAADTTPPTAPTITIGTVTANTVAMTFSGATDPGGGVVGYDVYRDGVLVGSTATTSYTDSGLQPATTYAYTAKAKDAVPNYSPFSASVNGTTAAASSDIAYDQFTNRTNASSLGTSESGHLWTARTGVWGVGGAGGGFAAYLPNNTNDAHATIASTVADANVEIEYTNAAATPGYSATGGRLIVRWSATTDYIFAENTASGVQLFKKVGGANTALGTAGGVVVAGDKIRIRMVGSTIELYRNDVLVTTVTETFNQTATIHGIGTVSNGGTTGPRYDNFRVYAA